MRKSVFSLVVLSLMSLGLVTVILFNSTPQNGVLTIFAFYFCLAIFIWTLFSIALITLKIKSKNLRQGLPTIFRRSFLISIITVSIIFFSSISVLNVLSVITIVSAAFLTELFFINRVIEKSK